MPIGGSTDSRRAPTPSTWSRSCRWRSTNCPASIGSSTSVAATARSAGCWPRPGREWWASTRRGTRSASPTSAAGERRSPGPARPNCPSPTSSFDAVVACLVFEHIDDVDDAIAEVARVVRPGGRFSFFLNHPLLQTPGSYWIDDHTVEPPEQYWRDRARTSPSRPSSSRSSTACSSGSCIGRCRGTSTRSPTTVWFSSAWSSRCRPTDSSPAPRSTPRPPPSPACCTSASGRNRRLQ